MISLLIGKIVDNNGTQIVVLTSGGVGYQVFIKPNLVDTYKVGEEVKLTTYLAVSETAMNLYGFNDKQERELFLYLISVSGIGPKSGLHLLSLGTVEDISNAISNKDINYLTQVSWVGKKTAERLVVELKNKVKNTNSQFEGNSKQGSILADVVEGLIAMGYSAQQAREAIKKLAIKNKSSEELLREALQTISQ